MAKPGEILIFDEGLAKRAEELKDFIENELGYEVTSPIVATNLSLVRGAFRREFETKVVCGAKDEEGVHHSFKLGPVSKTITMDGDVIKRW